MGVYSVATRVALTALAAILLAVVVSAISLGFHEVVEYLRLMYEAIPEDVPEHYSELARLAVESATRLLGVIALAVVLAVVSAVAISLLSALTHPCD